MSGLDGEGEISVLKIVMMTTTMAERAFAMVCWVKVCAYDVCLFCW